MFKKRHDELHSFLEWRRQTRFIRHHGGPIMAVVLFVTCLCFVWRARPIRAPEARDLIGTFQTNRPSHATDPFLQASKFTGKTTRPAQ